MALDRIYDLHVDGGENSETIWVGHSVTSGLANIGEPVDQGGVLYQPRSSIVVRVRWRDDIQPHVTRLVDSQGRVWRVGETLEIGRRRWLDVSLSTYDLPGEQPVTDPEDVSFVPPEGWFLQWRRSGGTGKHDTSGIYVSSLTVNLASVDDFTGADTSIFDVVVPSPGWAVALGLLEFTGSDGGSQLLGRQIPATSPTVPNLTHIGVTPQAARAVASNNFDSGSTFPTFTGGAFFAISGNFAIASLAPGTVINIAPGS